MSKATPPIAAVLTIALLAFVPSAGAEEIVPPGNSAASQYTEAFPTTGGERETEGRKQGKAVPADVLGARNSHQLESKGKEGKAVAEFAAETAPAPVSSSSGQSSGGSASGEDDGEGKAGGAAARGGGSGSGGAGAGGGAAGGGSGDSAAGPATGEEGSAGATAQQNGSSGFGEVLGQMTGSSSGKLGLWLPLIVIGAVIWSLFHLWRQRQRVV